MATRLNVANEAGHRALSDARLVIDVFLEMLKGVPTVKNPSELMRVSELLTFTEATVFAIDPPMGSEVLTTIAERCAIMIVYDRGSPRP